MRSARRPVHRPAGEQVQVQMKHRLPAVAIAVDHAAIAVVGEMAQLGLELVARHLVEMKNREERAEAGPEDKGRIPAADEVETAAGFAASL